LISVNDYWKNWDDINANKALNGIGKPSLSLVQKKSKDNTYVYELTNNSKELAVAIKLNAKDKSTGEIILPAYFSDGYLNLLPRETRVIRLELPLNAAKGFSIIAEGYNLDSVTLL